MMNQTSQGNPIIKDLASSLGIMITTPEGEAKIDQLAEVYAAQAVDDAIQQQLNPRALELAVTRRIQGKVFGGKLF